MHHSTTDRPLTPPGAERRHVSTAAGRLGVLHAGVPTPGRYPLVLVHGGGTDSSSISWYRLVEPLAADREVWAVDLPGFGTSMDVAPVGGPGRMADVLAEALAALGVGPAAVCGVSMGGDVALNLALRHPERVAGLVLIAPAGSCPHSGPPACTVPRGLLRSCPTESCCRRDGSRTGSSAPLCAPSSKIQRACPSRWSRSSRGWAGTPVASWGTPGTTRPRWAGTGCSTI
ncbi:alpha/beta fold hydrolase [Kocuria arenosa]|uniref:alpha/beta fold hydrolase n=1 Tax=Kocuria arenosa TaxID=3071446 RepID=UPI0034D51B63